MEANTPPLVSIKVSTFYLCIGIVILLGLGLIIFDVSTGLASDRQLAVFGTIATGICAVIGLWAYVTGFVTKVGPHTAYIHTDVTDPRRAEAEDVIFDNKEEATYFCVQLSGKKITYQQIDRIPLEITTLAETIHYAVVYTGGWKELLALRRAVKRNDTKAGEQLFNQPQSPVLWFRTWVRYKNVELQSYIANLENRTGSPHDREEVIQKLHLAYSYNYGHFGLTLDTD